MGIGRARHVGELGSASARQYRIVTRYCSGASRFRSARLRARPRRHRSTIRYRPVPGGVGWFKDPRHRRSGVFRRTPRSPLLRVRVFRRQILLLRGERRMVDSTASRFPNDRYFRTVVQFHQLTTGVDGHDKSVVEFTPQNERGGQSLTED